MDRTCPACSARLDQHATRCPNCGADLAASGTDQSTEAGTAGEAVRNTAAAAHLSTFAGFGISIAIYGSVLLVAALMLVGIPLLMVGVVAWVVLASLAAVKASQGQAYRYPLTLRLVR